MTQRLPFISFWIEDSQLGERIWCLTHIHELLCSAFVFANKYIEDVAVLLAYRLQHLSEDGRKHFLVNVDKQDWFFITIQVRVVQLPL